MVYAAAEVRYSHTGAIDANQELILLSTVTDGPVVVDWSLGSAIDCPVADLELSPEANARFADVPAAAGKVKHFDAWRKDLANWIYRNKRLELLECPGLQMVSNPGESERDFRIRLQQSARERRDEAVESLRQKYAPRIAALEDRARRALQAVDREAEQAKNQKLQTAISFGATLLSSFMGRKLVSLTTLGRATTAARGVSRSMKESDDVDRAQESVEAIDQKLADLNTRFQAETDALEKWVDPHTGALERVSLKPTKSNIAIKLVTLAWAPCWRDTQGHLSNAWE
jgi:hypothetical protein